MPAQDKEWSLHFEPKLWQQEHPDQTMEACRLSRSKMLKHGQDITQIRDQLRAKALELERSDAEHQPDQQMDEQSLQLDQALQQDISKVGSLAARMNRGYFNSKVL